MFLQWENFENEKTTKCCIVLAKDSCLPNPKNDYLWYSQLLKKNRDRNIISRQNPIIIVPVTENYKPFTSIDNLSDLINGSKIWTENYMFQSKMIRNRLFILFSGRVKLVSVK